MIEKKLFLKKDFKSYLINATYDCTLLPSVSIDILTPTGHII